MGLAVLKSKRRWVVALALALAAAWRVPSFLSAERYRYRLEIGLERALHRRTTFGAISFRLLPRPGFTIENVVVHDHPAFGAEPFAHVERVECDLRWQTLWRSRLDIARLRLDRVSLNVVRNARGRWNVEDLLLASGMVSRAVSAPGDARRSPRGLMLEADAARINFKVGDTKKPFAIVDLRARLDFDTDRGLLKFQVVGSPLRSDSSLPTPGPVELTGSWTPGGDLEGPLEATLRTRQALLYDWVPLLTGHNPEIYGVLDVEVRLSGSLRDVQAEGECHLSQLHRSEQLPPADPMPVTVRFRGGFDRGRARVVFESLEAAVADSHLHMSGTIENLTRSPEADLVVALERSATEDLLSLGRRLAVVPAGFGLSGRIDGLLSVRGAWSARRYGGFVSVRDARLSTSAGAFPVSEVSARIDNEGATLAPVTVALAPHVELAVEGVLRRYGVRDAPHQDAPAPPAYELTVTAKAIPLGDLVGFARALGIHAARSLEAQGIGTATLTLRGSAWPLKPAAISGHAELRAARVLVPGLTEPVNLPRARLEINGEELVVDPVVAVLGTTVFSGRLDHRGDRKQPWRFEMRAGDLRLEEAAQWFEALSPRRPIPLIERLPGLSSLVERRAARDLFSGLNAQGQLAVPTLSYRAVTLRDVRVSVEIAGRMVRLTKATFHAGGGRGEGTVVVKLTDSPAAVTADVKLTGLGFESLAPYFPAALRRVRGSVSATGHFETRGLTRQEAGAHLEGRASLGFKKVILWDFDPLDALARGTGEGVLEPARGPVELPTTAPATLRVRNRTVTLETYPVDLTGARLRLSGTYSFDGALDLDVRADMRRAKRRWVATETGSQPNSRSAELHLTGPLAHPSVTPGRAVSRAAR